MATSREIILEQLKSRHSIRPGAGNPVSSTTVWQQEKMNSYFPEAHYDAKKMFELARANYEILDFDMIMPVFSVVIESYALGCAVKWGSSYTMPQITGKLWKDYKDIEIKKDFLSNHAVRAVLDCISMLKASYPGVAITGKVFGPWTLAYHFFGVSDFLIKTIDNPSEVRDILEKLLEVTLAFAEAQAEAGADVLTVADHATRDLCSPESYRDFLIPVHTKIAREVRVPVILHICGNTKDRIEYICKTGFAGFHFESKVDACNASEISAGRICLAGNINNPSTLLFRTPEDVRREVRHAINCGINIVGPECAVPLYTPDENLRVIADEVKSCRIF